MKNAEKMAEKIATFAQSCFQKHPVVILGSGASVVYGLRGMNELAQYLRDYIQPDEGEEADAWLSIKTALDEGDGLEEALLKTAAPSSLVTKIVALTWLAVAEDDLALMGRSARGEECFNLADLLRGMFKSTRMVADIVTLNYDRVAEYASDMAGYFHATGFAPGIIRAREVGDPFSIRRGGQAVRTVRIWKVHGSLDWFSDAAGRVVSLPVPSALPEGLEPLIVTPGVSKFERTQIREIREAW